MKSSERARLALIRRREVAALYLARATRAEIAERTKASAATIDKDLFLLRKQWAVENREAVAEAVLRDLAALADDEKRLRTDMAKCGDDADRRVRVYDRVLRIMERRSKLLGLDAPERHVVEGSVAPIKVVLRWPTGEEQAPAASRLNGGNGHHGG